jgi:hypothetical protein
MPTLFLNFSERRGLAHHQLVFLRPEPENEFRINAHNRLYLSGYLGRDDFCCLVVLGTTGCSKTATVRWNHTFGEKLFSNTSMIYSNYSYQINIMEDTNVKIRSIIRDFNLKQDFALYQATNKTLKFGLNLIFHNIVPGEIKANPNSVYNSLELKDRKAIESSLYISQSLPLCDRLKMYYGLRLSLFANVGPGDFYQFDENGELLTTTTYDSFHWVKTQGGRNRAFVNSVRKDARESFVNRLTVFCTCCRIDLVYTTDVGCLAATMSIRTCDQL